MFIVDYCFLKYGGKVFMFVFMKLFVVQYVESFKKLFNILFEKINVLIGELFLKQRVEVWKNSVVIIVMFQMVENDILIGRIFFEDVVLFVFDEVY